MGKRNLGIFSKEFVHPHFSKIKNGDFPRRKHWVLSKGNERNALINGICHCDALSASSQHHMPMPTEHFVLAWLPLLWYNKHKCLLSLAVVEYK
ncbi:MAG: hypothetical protein E7280_08135 [Lachnospiraceae bacterium]|nr:hypothetical protein [Lachnospiraceae bacterium]